ncbi:MFS transporter [Glutamicibacter sp. HZAU]|uniref:MFS transporter n=1 Tax=Glutamicibacter sp. HZAU TaxID=2049891 RepID=UPI000FFC05D5|nr:MFS transporter [Glutamicibacter sp. HZAU]MDV2980748.1 MFS transporter [Actinomycetes bacterium ARC8]RWZ82126.1 MFS transporter [Glutamicibacter sp. HZAU]
MEARNSRKPRFRRKRRLKVEDVNVVDDSMLKKAIGGTVVGNLMEWYDVGVYGYLAVIIGKLFMPDTVDPAIQTLFSLGVFAVTFVARPLGGVILGQLGDRVGRQKILVFTLLMMALATFGIGILPDYSVWGVAAPILLVVLKLIQGFSTGGEYAGATTFITEYAPDKRRGFFASLLDLGSYMGFAMGAAFVSILQLTLSEDVMEGFAWRIPFLVALPLGVIALWFRSKIEDTPAFKEAQEAANRASDDARNSADAPKGVIDLVKAYWRELLTGFVLVSAANTAGYALTSYMPTYLTETLKYDPVHGNLLTLPILVGMSLCIPLAGMLSDSIGRRKVLFIGSGSAVVLAIPAFLFMMHGQIWSTLTGLALLAIPVVFYVSNLASSLPALFPTASRYGGMGISYNFAVAIFGGFAPFIMQALVTMTNSSLAPAFWVMGTSVAGIIAVCFLKESARRPLPGSLPSVATEEEAVELVATQEENPDLDVEDIFEQVPALEENYQQEIADAKAAQS